MVPIRCGKISSNKLTLYAGAGLVEGSIPQQEKRKQTGNYKLCLKLLWGILSSRIVNFTANEIADANHTFGAYFAQVLSLLGLEKIFFSPGSRSTPMIIGVERYSNIDLIPVLDERTASFLALGHSKREKNRLVSSVPLVRPSLIGFPPSPRHHTQASHFFYFQLTVRRSCRIVVLVRLLIKKISLEISSVNFTNSKSHRKMRYSKIN